VGHRMTPPAYLLCNAKNPFVSFLTCTCIINIVKNPYSASCIEWHRAISFRAKARHNTVLRFVWKHYLCKPICCSVGLLPSAYLIQHLLDPKAMVMMS